MLSKSRAKSPALLPVTPTRKNIASNSASESASAPSSISFSRRSSASGQSGIAISIPSQNKKVQSK